MVPGRTDLAPIRRDPTKAAAVLAAIFPEARARQQALRILADAINRAHRVAPASWGVSLFHNRLCLNVGRGAVLQFYPGEVMFILTGRRLKLVPASPRRAFRINRKYKFVKDSVEGRDQSQGLLEAGGSPLGPRGTSSSGSKDLLLERGARSGYPRSFAHLRSRSARS